MLGIRWVLSPVAHASISLERAPFNFDEDEHRTKGC